ncbi:2-C-methyl-D-erythritol 4-phosphate cytidylyltransferase [Nitrospirota bacterium]
MSINSLEKAIAIIPAAGLGKRFVEGSNKPFFALEGKPLLAWVLDVLEQSPLIEAVVPIVKEQDLGLCKGLVEASQFTKVRAIVPGGIERQDSVYNGLKAINGHNGPVLVHDGARPFITQDIVERCIKGIDGFDGAIAAVPPKDTIKESSPDGTVKETLDRNNLFLVQTPQAFSYETLWRAYQDAEKHSYYSTDDSALVERLGGKVNIVMGSYDNIKVTTPEDIQVAAAILKRISK